MTIAHPPTVTGAGTGTKQRKPRPSPRGWRSSRIFCPTIQKRLLPIKMGSQVKGKTQLHRALPKDWVWTPCVSRWTFILRPTTTYLQRPKHPALQLLSLGEKTFSNADVKSPGLKQKSELSGHDGNFSFTQLPL